MTTAHAKPTPPAALAVSQTLSTSNARLVGLLLGIAAAIVGVTSPIESVPIRPWYVLVVLAAIVSLGAALDRAGEPLLTMRIRALDLAFIAYVVAGVVVEAVNGFELHYPADVSSYIEPFCWMLAYFAARVVSSSVESAVVLIRAFVLPIFLMAPIGVAQILDLGGINHVVTGFVSSAGFQARLEGDRLLRAIGLIGHWTGFGAYSAVVFTACVALLIASRRLGVGTQRYAIAALLFATVCLATTLTFSPILVAVGVLLMSARAAGFNIRLIAGLGLVAVLVGILFGALVQERVEQQLTYGAGQVDWVPEWVPSTIRYRIGIWATQTIPMMTERPLTGWGSGVYSTATSTSSAAATRLYPSQLDWPSPESQWFSAAMNGGIFLLIALIALIGAALLLTYSARKASESKWLALPLFWMIAVAIFFAATAPMFTNRGMPLPMWVLAGAVAGLAEVPRPASDTPAQADRRTPAPNRRYA